MKMFVLIASACFLLLIISKPSVTVLSDEATPTPVSFVEVAKWGEEDTSSPNWHLWEKVHISPDGIRIAALAFNHISIWNLNGEVIQIIEDTGLHDFTWSPDSNFIAGCRSEDGTLSLIVIEIETGEVNVSKSFNDGHLGNLPRVMGVSWHPSDNLIASTGTMLLLWDVENMTSPTVLRTSVAGEAVAWSPEGDLLANVGLHYESNVDIPTGSLEIMSIDSSSPPTNLGEGYKVLAWHPDGQMLASMADVEEIGIWDVETGEEIFRLHIPDVNIISLAWHPKGRWLASGDTSGSVRIWDTNTKTEVTILEGHPTTVVGDGWGNTNVISGLDWDSQGEFLVSAGYDGTIRIWKQF